jgi:transcription initiation factor IIF auxiliary subunit
MRSKFDIRVADTVLIDARNKNGAMYRLSDAGVHRYKVRIFLEGQDLPFVRQVTYGLHKTFRNPHRVVERTISNPDCRLEIWTWGIFEVTADVQDNTGQVYRLTHQLTYGKELENLAPNRFRKVS